MKTQPSPDRQLKIKHDGQLTIATAPNRSSMQWKNQQLLWSDFAKKVAETTRTRETVAEYLKLTKTQQGSIKDVGGFVGGSLKEGRRKADKVAWRQLLTLDADHIVGDFWDGVTMLFDHAALIYSTHKHTPEHPRLRLIIPLARPVSPEEYVAVAKKVAEQFGIDMFDDTTYEPHRLMYWPSTSADGEFVFEVQDGTWLDPDTVLAQYVNWQDPNEWPESSRQREVRKKMADRQGDPLTKPGLIGAFNRTYTVPEAIDTFLADQYDEAGPGRYTYVDGSTFGGLVLYEDDLFAFSHHGTDPVSGQLVNAFDLVRLHLFGETDDEAKPGTPVNKLPSFSAMQNFARDDAAVKQTLTRERMEDARNEFEVLGDPEPLEEGKAPPEVDLKWAEQLQYSKSGDLEPTALNIRLILENDPLLAGKLAFDDFTKQPAITASLPWRKVEKGKSDLWSNADDQDLRTYLDITWQIRFGVGKIDDVLGGVMRANTFHPVLDYLDSLTWDGIPRVETLLVEYLGAEDTPYVRAVTRKVLAGAVARVKQPGCKFDYMLTLVGPQGIGKSMLFNKLGGAWFSDSLMSVHGKEAYEALHGVWIMEMGELAATRKAEVEAIKQFLSKQSDRYRVAYGKRAEEFKRQCIFVGTTNEHDFLKDKTGNRRFWPVRVSWEGMTKTWRMLDKDTVDQIWAEAVRLYLKGEELFLSDDIERAAREEQEYHTEESPWYGLIEEYLNTPIPLNWYDLDIIERRAYLDGDMESNEEVGARDRVCALEVWCEVLGNDRRRFPRMEQREINEILRRMPGWKAYDNNRTGQLKFGNYYGLQRAYVRNLAVNKD